MNYELCPVRCLKKGIDQAAGNFTTERQGRAFLSVGTYGRQCGGRVGDISEED